MLQPLTGSSCGWILPGLGFLPLPFLLPSTDWPQGSLSLINHFHRNVWLGVCFWENPGLRCIRQAPDSPAVHKPRGHSVSEFAPLQ